jgi:quercetin dioxygenase-like cupin family protein
MAQFQVDGTRREGATGGTADRPARSINGPLAVVDLSAETASLRNEPIWQTANINAMTLSKEPDIRLVLTTVKLGAVMRQHSVPGTLAVQTLSGRIRLKVADQRTELSAGQVLILERNIPHDIEAIEDSTFLLTIAWPGREQADLVTRGG